MAEQNGEKKAWWSISEDEKKGLESAPQDALSIPIQSAVPVFTDVVKGAITGSYGKKDGLLLYHFYKTDRKNIYDDAQSLMQETPGSNEQIAEQANEKLEAHPWWEGFEGILHEIFTDHFKYQEFKITYYIEVDSWSVMLQEPKTPVPMSKAQLELIFSRVSLRVTG